MLHAAPEREKHDKMNQERHRKNEGNECGRLCTLQPALQRGKLKRSYVRPLPRITSVLLNTTEVSADIRAPLTRHSMTRAASRRCVKCRMEP